MPKINKTKYALLGVLSYQAQSGYDIKKFCDASIAHFWNENYAHIYPVLKEMEKEGLVVKKTEQNEGRPPKNVYSITEDGRKELNSWLLKPVEEESGRNELLLKLFFSSDIPLDNLIENMKKEKERHEKLIEEYKKIEKILKENEQMRSHKDLPLWLSTLNYGMISSEAGIKWCDETIEYLRKSNCGDSSVD